MKNFIINGISTILLTLFSLYGFMMLVILVGTEIHPTLEGNRILIWIIGLVILLGLNLRKHIKIDDDYH